MKANFWVPVTFLLLTWSGIALAQRPHAMDDKAMTAAKCVRNAMKAPLDILSPLKPEDQTTEDDRKRIALELKRMTEAQAKGVKKCLTEDEAYQLGWFEFLEVVAVDKCGMRRTAALNSHSDGTNTDLLNGAASWEPIGESPEKLPFFRGQSDARAAYRSAPLVKMCADLRNSFGPTGNKFPGLVW